MMIFFGGSQKVAIPESRIYSIQQNDNQIVVNYENGDFVLTEGNNFPVPQIKTLYLKFEDTAKASVVMYNFYQALQKGANAYFFGDTKFQMPKEKAITTPEVFPLWF